MAVRPRVITDLDDAEPLEILDPHPAATASDQAFRGARPRSAIVLVLVVVLLGGAAVAGARLRSPSSRLPLLAAGPIAAPTRAETFVVRAIADAATARRLAALLGIHAGPTRVDNGFVVDDANGTLELDNDGTVTYTRMNPDYDTNAPASADPQRAAGLLAQVTGTRDWDVQPQRSFYTGPIPYTPDPNICVDCGRLQPQLSTLTATRVVHGESVDGMQWTIGYDARDNVSMLRGRMLALHSLGLRRLRPIADAYAIENATNVRLGYALWNGRDGKNYVVPTFVANEGSAPVTMLALP